MGTLVLGILIGVGLSKVAVVEDIRDAVTYWVVDILGYFRNED